MRPVTSKLTRMLMARFIEDNGGGSTHQSFTPKNKEMQERTSLSSSRAAIVTPEWDAINSEINKGLRVILQHLNFRLHTKEYFGDNRRISIDDIMIYNEIATIQALANK